MNSNQYTTPEVLSRVNNTTLKAHVVGGNGNGNGSNEVNLRNLNQRVTGKHRLQPINLTSKISSDSFKKPIESGSYVVETANIDGGKLRSNQRSVKSTANQSLKDGIKVSNKSRCSNF
mmetsp:Transcript_42339/g.55804  ORF Transcript_42339/g.55804 Transcript_42339/m.55804 type:complete len:118 (-) Transcript_42339:71-424(-)